MSSAAGLSTPGSTEAAWPAVIMIALGAFVMVTSEFLPIGLLGSIAGELSVTQGEAGLMMTAPGLIAAVAAPFLTMRAGRMDRRTLLIALTLMIVLADVVVAVAHSLPVVLAGRMLLGVALGGFWAFAAASGRRLVPAAQGNRATALVLGGISVGTVLGVPIGTLVGGIAGWRAAFGGIACLTAVACFGQIALLPSLPGQHPGSLRDLFDILRVPAIRLGFVAAALIAGGHFAAYTYLEPFLASIRLSGSGLTIVLAGYGLAGIAGTWLGERYASRNVHVTFAVVGFMIAGAIAVAYLAGAQPIVSGLLVMLWGGAFGALPVCLTIWNYQAAPERFETGSALTVTVFQISVASGAFLGGVTVDHSGVGAAYALGSVSAAIAGVLLITRLRGSAK